MDTLINRFSDCKALVIGDAILDNYLKGSTTKICREAPAPVFDVETEEAVCGGAANAAINCASLGASTWFASVTGNDIYADTIISILQHSGVNLNCMVRDPKRSTMVKQRLMSEINLLYRIDQGTTTPITAEIENELIRKISVHWDSADVIILSDYGNGIITERIIDFIFDVQLHLPKPLIVDAKDPTRFSRLKPKAVKPNYTEAISLLGCPALPRSERANQMFQHQPALFESTGADFICVTLDKDGVVLLSRESTPQRILCIPFDNKNAIGAGDTFTAAFSLAYVQGASAAQACHIAANAAAVVVQKEGTAGCTRGELSAHMKVLPKFISSTETLGLIIGKAKQNGKRIVFTNGCFDILHKGHINLLEEARKLGDLLVLAVNNDDSIRKLKGEDRPVNTLEDRISVLSALEAVDLIIAFEEETSAHLIRLISPDVFVKGSSYANAAIPEADLVRSLGGTVEILRSTFGHSTSGIIKKIRQFDQNARAIK
jgi:D-beta-D-heptose 7-phosphate kinase/D-beta-D-heptose 1-phosphate adenosyltransferase